MTADEELVRLLWGRTAPPSRGPRPSLDLQRIAAETIAVADEEGLAVLSMQKVAARLGVSKMALYRYVRSRDDLVAIAVEQAVGEPPGTSDADGDWRARTLLWAERLRAVWVEHPWLPATAVGERMMGPREIGWSEAAARALRGSGQEGGELLATITLLFAHARAELAGDLSGTQHWRVHDELGEELRAHLHEERDRFPLLSAAEDGALAGFDAWRYGLEIVLDGVAARSAAAAAAPRR